MAHLKVVCPVGHRMMMGEWCWMHADSVAWPTCPTFLRTWPPVPGTFADRLPVEVA